MRLSRAAKAIRKLGPCHHLYVALATHVHTPDVSSHMRNRWGLMLARTSYGWRDLISLRTRSMDRCVALPSHLPTLSYLRHTISSEKGDVLDSIDDDDDIEWPVNHLIIAMIRTPRLYKSYWPWFVSTVLLDSKRNRGSSIRVRHQSDKVEPVIIVVDRGKWEVSRNRLPPWHHNIDMQTAIREQVDALLCLGVIEASHAPIWSQVRIVPKPDGKWRFALDFIRLIACTGALEVWPIPDISYTLKRIGDTAWIDWFRLMRCLDIVPNSLKWSRCRQLMIRREYLETYIERFHMGL
jgi:hypothetical protein